MAIRTAPLPSAPAGGGPEGEGLRPTEAAAPKPPEAESAAVRQAREIAGQAERTAEEKGPEQALKGIAGQGDTASDASGGFNAAAEGIRGAFDAKLQDYADRIREGQNPNVVLAGLPLVWREGVNKILSEQGTGSTGQVPSSESKSLGPTLAGPRPEQTGYNPDLDPLVQVAIASPDPASFLNRPLAPGVRAAIQAEVARRAAEAAPAGGEQILRPVPPSADAARPAAEVPEPILEPVAEPRTAIEPEPIRTVGDEPAPTGPAEGATAGGAEAQSFVEADRAAALQPETDVEAQLKAQSEALADEIRKTASVDDLQGSIKGLSERAGQLNSEIQRLDEQINAATDPVERTRLQREKLEKVNAALEVRQNLTKDQTALGEARARTKVEVGGTEQEQDQQLAQAMRDTEPATREQFAEIAKRIESGGEASTAEKAQYAMEVARRMGKGGEGYNPAGIIKMNARYPEVGRAILDKITNSQDFVQELKKKVPNNWEKVLKFAKSKGGLLWLLAIIFGGAAIAIAKMAGANPQGLRRS